jgi:rhamnose transport system permease protein
VLSGLISGLAAVLWISRFESAQTNTALGFELNTVTAAVIGGVSTSGGVGSIPGVLLGALLLGIIQNSLTLIRISPFWQLAAQGLLIIVAVVTDKLISKRVVRTNK